MSMMHVEIFYNAEGWSKVQISEGFPIIDSKRQVQVGKVLSTKKLNNGLLMTAEIFKPYDWLFRKVKRGDFFQTTS